MDSAAGIALKVEKKLVIRSNKSIPPNSGTTVVELELYTKFLSFSDCVNHFHVKEQSGLAEHIENCDTSLEYR